MSKQKFESRIRGPAVWAGVWLMAKETEISAVALWALWLRKDFTFTLMFCILYYCTVNVLLVWSDTSPPVYCSGLFVGCLESVWRQRRWHYNRLSENGHEATDVRIGSSPFTDVCCSVCLVCVLHQLSTEFQL